MKNFIRTIRHWHFGNPATRNIRRLSDHMLSDIGITRGDMRSPANIFH